MARADYENVEPILQGSAVLGKSFKTGKALDIGRTRDFSAYENGVKEPGQFYHQVYTDGRYVYDPRLSSNPIAKGDWEQHIKNINPDGVSISDKLKGLK